MSYKIKASKEFERKFRKLNKNLQGRIKKKFLEVAENPERYKHLRGNLAGRCRIWISKLRIIFSYSAEEKILFLKTIVFKHKY
tara:strand:- start:176 stop:424 length:249 start_codon:yes stop_codon:yes gene_type:complete